MYVTGMNIAASTDPGGAIVSVVTLTPAPHAGTNPARAYLAGLAESGRRGMATALTQAADVLTQGAGTIDTTPWHHLTPDHVTAIKRQLTDGGAAPATVNRMVSALRGVARSAWRAGLITAEQQARINDVPLAKARRLPRGRHVDAAEIRALFAAVGSDPAGARDAAMLSLLYGGGLRRSEAVAVQAADYDTATGALTIRQGKGGHQRIVHATNGGAEAIAAWLRVRGDHDGAVLAAVGKGGRVDRSGQPMTGSAVHERLRVLATRAGVASFSPHDLRRSFVGALLDAGADVGAVQGLAGHASVNTTLRYDRRPETARRKAAELLHVPYHAPAA